MESWHPHNYEPSAPPFFAMRVAWVDGEVVEIENRLCAPIFSGAANVYMQWEDLTRLADDVQQFADTLDGGVEWPAGRENAAGLLELRLRRFDRAGHVVCDVRLETQALGGLPASRLSHFLGTECQYVETFVRSLRQITQTRSGEARLIGVWKP